MRVIRPMYIVSMIHARATDMFSEERLWRSIKTSKVWTAVDDGTEHLTGSEAPKISSTGLVRFVLDRV